MADERTRRQVLAGTGAALAGLAGAGTVAGQLGGEYPHFSEWGGSVTRTYDESVLDAYRPFTDTRPVEGNLPTAYGFVARSPDYDTTAVYQWLQYAYQDGATSLDSHLGDHEPVVCFVSEDDREIVEIVYSGYHWLAARDPAPATYTDDGGVHPTLEIISPWHHYVRSERAVENRDNWTPDLRHLSDDRYRSWLDNGLAEDIAPGAVTEPWTMATHGDGGGRSDWWREGAGFVSLTSLYWQVNLALGRAGGGAEQTDLRG